MGYAYIYLLVTLTIMTWFIGYVWICMDRYDRLNIRRFEAWSLATLYALFWPLTLLYRPIFLRNPQKLFVSNPERARFERDRDSALQEITRCTNRVCFEVNHEEKPTGIFEFSAESIAIHLAQRTDKDGYGSLAALPEIQKWVVNADHTNQSVSKVPWIWRSFNLLTAELIENGVGTCFCAQCQILYKNKELNCGIGDGSIGWVALIIKCPHEHEVLKFDLLKPFCSHRRS